MGDCFLGVEDHREGAEVAKGSLRSSLVAEGAKRRKALGEIRRSGMAKTGIILCLLSLRSLRGLCDSAGTLRRFYCHHPEKLTAGTGVNPRNPVPAVFGSAATNCR
jgi:hypothetical protein